MFLTKSSGMDGKTHERMMQVIFEAVASGTVLFVTHHAENLGMFDQILEVKNGVVADVVKGGGDEIEAL